ncbi:Retrovirus-related polyprotein from transposon [Salix suchowensis]|nr:Retrovirus-related polyprotein from transposon [Salix suchowensis]
MDVHNAFLHGDLTEEIYMSVPQGLQRQRENNLVCRLHKSLYGLKQASRQWFAKFSEAMLSAGFVQSRADYSLFTIKQGAAPINTPIEQGLKLSDKGPLLKNANQYRTLVGRLIYLTVSRPDITYDVHVLSRFMQQPWKLHMEAALRVVRYLKGAPARGLFFSSKNDLRLRVYCDSD